MRILYITSVTLVGLVLTSSIAHAETALEHLQTEPRPVFKEGHTLLPLSRWGWSLPVETSVELCEHWGYALESKVFIDEAGEITLNARPAGSVYRITAEVKVRFEPPIVKMELLDKNAMRPSIGFD
jgi:hypothetical protein